MLKTITRSWREGNSWLEYAALEDSETGKIYRVLNPQEMKVTEVDPVTWKPLDKEAIPVHLVRVYINGVARPESNYYAFGAKSDSANQEQRHTAAARIRAAVENHDMEVDNLNKLLALAYYMGREEAAKEVSDKYNALLAEQTKRAEACRYHKMAATKQNCKGGIL